MTSFEKIFQKSTIEETVNFILNNVICPCEFCIHNYGIKCPHAGVTCHDGIEDYLKSEVVEE